MATREEARAVKSKIEVEWKSLPWFRGVSLMVETNGYSVVVDCDAKGTLPPEIPSMIEGVVVRVESYEDTELTWVNDRRV